MLKEYLEEQSQRTKKLLSEMENLGAKIKVLSREYRILEVVYKKKSFVMFRNNTNLNNKLGFLLAKNKDITKVLMEKKGISVPKGIVADSFSSAVEKLKKQKLFFPFCVKPIDLSKGHGVTLNVKNLTQLKEAIKKALVVMKETTTSSCGKVIVEEMKVGNDYRILVLKNKVIACCERVPAYIIGDGKNTVKWLIENFNKKRPPCYMLVIDEDLESMLKKGNLDLSSILKKNQRIKLRNNANISSGGRSFDKTDIISQRFKEIAVNAAKSLELKLCGIDLLTFDIGSNDNKQEYAVIEVNSNPDYDIHEKPIVIGKGVDVSKILTLEFFQKNI